MMGLSSYFLVAIRRNGADGAVHKISLRLGDKKGVKTRELGVQGQPGLSEALSQSPLLSPNLPYFFLKNLKLQHFKSSQMHLCVRGTLSLK